MQNIEFKAELRDLPLARTICGSIGALHADTLEQTDTYFRIPDGRLKKRETVGRPTEWVSYSRAERSRPKLSDFTIYTEEHAAARFGTQAPPVWVVVRKSRELWVIDGVRIHLDRVENLGNFIEFEALICPERDLATCHDHVATLRAAFQPIMGEPIACGYADLLAGETPTATGSDLR